MSSRPTAWVNCTHAIVVCGHAVFTGGASCSPQSVLSDSNWTLQSFQAGEPHFYVEHIRVALDLAGRNPEALVIFSGGQTRAHSILSEGQSYYHAAQALGLLTDSQLAARVTTEEFARDSYDNCIFGIARFAECTGKLPKKLSIVSWEFKRERFELHVVDTLGWPAQKYSYVGSGSPDDIEGALSGEEKTLRLFREDATGYGGGLGRKKQARNPYARQHGYIQSVPSMARVLSHTASSPVPKAVRPW